MTYATIPAAQAATAARRATCDGAGLITIPTDAGPAHFRCVGCRSCSGPRPVRRIPRDPFADMPRDDDEAF